MLKYYYEGDFMNRKGFTLVEVLAVVVILSIIKNVKFIIDHKVEKVVSEEEILKEIGD